MVVSEIMARVYSHTDDEGAVAATNTEVLAAINEGQELACLLSLCLERWTVLPLQAGASWGTFLDVFPDFICPLWLAVFGKRVRPATLVDFDAENEAWQAATGIPTHYAAHGCNLYAVNCRPASTISAEFAYARSPVIMNSSSTPEIPAQYHRCLADYASYRVRLKEGAQGLARANVYLNRYLDDITELGNFIRARSRAAALDVLPFELALFDRSRMAEPAPKKAAK